MNRKVYRQEQKDWAKNAEFYLYEADSPFRKILCAEMMEKFRLTKKHQKILDLGASSGDFANYLTKTLGSSVIGVDFAPEMKQVARRFYPGLPYLVASAIKLPFKDASFDAVVAGGLLHHLKVQENLKKSLAEISRILKPGGYFCYLDRSDSPVAKIAELFLGFIKKLFSMAKGNYTACSTSSERLLSKADLKLIRSHFKSVARRPAYSLPFKFLLVTSYFLQYSLGKNYFLKFQRTTIPLARFYEKHLNFKLWETEFCEVLKRA